MAAGVAAGIAARMITRVAARMAAKTVNFEKTGLPRPDGLWQSFENSCAILDEEELLIYHDHNGLSFSDAAERIVVRF